MQALYSQAVRRLSTSIWLFAEESLYFKINKIIMIITTIPYLPFLWIYLLIYQFYLTGILTQEKREMFR